MNIKEAIEKLKADELKEQFNTLYGSNDYDKQKLRYLALIKKYKNTFEQSDIKIISSPGRTELGGNHTDHNHGRVLAASIQLDSIAVVSENDSNKVIVYSEGFAQAFTVEISNLDNKAINENATTSLIRGILSIFKSEGKKIGGFNAYIASDVLIGSGLSSSASIEVLIGKILSVLFNDDTVDSVELAKIGQKAENIFLEKPCGLMDQMACAYGGIIAIDFEDPSSPIIDSIDYSFEDNGYRLLVVDTGGDHADLTDDYAAIPFEMKSVAQYFGKSVCRSVNKIEFLKKIPELISSVGDRAILRTLHFLNEDERVVEMVNQLKSNQLLSYLQSVQKSGDSSYKFLQNVFTSKYVHDQKVSLAIALTETFDNFQGAVRVHGGGFAGTVQVYIENKNFETYKKYMEQFFGSDSVTSLKIRPYGAMAII